MFIYLFALIMVPSNSMAERVPYGPAGCGLGSVIMGPTPGFSQLMAATTNDFFPTQPLGILSGTSNCIPRKTSGSGPVAKVPNEDVYFYFDGNMDGIRLDLARGNGEHLEVLAFLSAWDSSVFKQTVAGKYNAIFPNETTDATQATENLVSLLERNKMARSQQLVATNP